MRHEDVVSFKLTIPHKKNSPCHFNLTFFQIMFYVRALYLFIKCYITPMWHLQACLSLTHSTDDSEKCRCFGVIIPNFPQGSFLETSHHVVLVLSSGKLLKNSLCGVFTGSECQRMFLCLKMPVNDDGHGDVTQLCYFMGTDWSWSLVIGV